MIHGSGCKQDPEASKHSQESSLKDTTPNYCFKYPGVIDSLDLQSLYDSARWQLYTCHLLHCGLPVQKNTSETFTLLRYFISRVFAAKILKQGSILFQLLSIYFLTSGCKGTSNRLVSPFSIRV